MTHDEKMKILFSDDVQELINFCTCFDSLSEFGVACTEDWEVNALQKLADLYKQVKKND